MAKKNAEKLKKEPKVKEKKPVRTGTVADRLDKLENGREHFDERLMKVEGNEEGYDTHLDELEARMETLEKRVVELATQRVEAAAPPVVNESLAPFPFPST